MMIRDGDGTLIEFQWPSLWYLAKAGFAVTLGVALAIVVLWVPFLILYLVFLSAAFRVFIH